MTSTGGRLAVLAKWIINSPSPVMSDVLAFDGLKTDFTTQGGLSMTHQQPLKPLVGLLLLCLVVTACSTSENPTPELDFSKLKQGMTRAEVVELFGEPTSTHQDGKETKLIYGDDGSQWVLIEDGKMTGWGGTLIPKGLTSG